MKRILFWGIFLALAISCSVKETDLFDGLAGETFYATIEQPCDTDTKVYVNNDLKVLWDEGDHISIFNLKDANDEYTFTGKTGDNGGTFELVKDFSEEGVSIDNIYAVYPYSKATSFNTKGTLSVEFPSQQHYRENSFGSGDNLMVSVSKDKNLQFKNVGGYLRIRLYGEGASVSTITLKGNNGERLAGKASITMPLDGIPSIELEDDAMDEITLTCDSPVKLGSSYEESTCFWFVVPPISFDKGFTITVYDRDGKCFEKTTQKAICIERNRLYKMGTLSFEELEPRFIKPAFSLKIVGPGAVDEYLSDSGTEVTLKAIPDVTKHALFKGWSGDIDETDSEISFSSDRDITIVATFATEVKKHMLPNLLLPTSVRKDIFYDVSFPNVNRCEYCALDYNQDGYVDLVTCFNSYEQNTRLPIQFYQGQPDGSFKLDELNSGRFDGLICWRKSLYGDFNGDQVPDICFVGHGWDEEPWPGEYPILLLSTADGRYEETRFTDIVGYFHGSAAGDYDNDGDLDIFLLDHSTNSWFLINDGHGHFTKNNDLYNSGLLAGSLYTTELFDLNHDGYLDLIVGGHEHEGPHWHQYDFPGFVFWGNGESYNHANYTRFPTFDKGWGVTLDYIFEDLDGDGFEEIINCRTGDGFYRESYKGWKIQIVAFDGSSFIDATSTYLDPEEGHDDDAIWLVKIGVEELDGSRYLIGISCDGRKQKLFKITGNHFERCEEESSQPLKYTSGICFYSDGVGSRGDHVQLDYPDNPYSGTTSIHFSNWPTWNGWSVDYEDWIDFSELEKQGYVLEFAIKNSDPDMLIAFSFETRLQTDPWYFPSYNYTYLASEHKCDGTWDLVQVPLSEMTCDPEWTGYYWNTIKTLNIMPWDCHGQDFFLDEIRIRKVIE